LLSFENFLKSGIIRGKIKESSDNLPSFYYKTANSNDSEGIYWRFYNLTIMEINDDANKANELDPELFNSIFTDFDKMGNLTCKKEDCLMISLIKNLLSSCEWTSDDRCNCTHCILKDGFNCSTSYDEYNESNEMTTFPIDSSTMKYFKIKGNYSGLFTVKSDTDADIEIYLSFTEDLPSKYFFDYASKSDEIYIYSEMLGDPLGYFFAGIQSNSSTNIHITFFRASAYDSQWLLDLISTISIILVFRFAFYAYFKLVNLKKVHIIF